MSKLMMALLCKLTLLAVQIALMPWFVVAIREGILSHNYFREICSRIMYIDLYVLFEKDSSYFALQRAVGRLYGSIPAGGFNNFLFH